jgi:hypothetical protein
MISLQLTDLGVFLQLIIAKTHNLNIFKKTN